MLMHNPGATPCPSGYSLDLYCRWLNADHRYNEFPHCYGGKTRGDVVSQARRDGWLVHRDGYATCPKCAKLPRPPLSTTGGFG